MKERDSRYELLRIIATIAITLNHVLCSKTALTANWYVRQFFFLGGQFGVNLFVIIGAWFLCSSAFKSSRVLRMVAQMFFYTLSLDVLSWLLGTPVTVGGFLKSFSYWFCFGYAVMLMIAPFLQKIDKNAKSRVCIVGGGIALGATVLGYMNPSLLIVRLSLKGLFIGPVWFSYVFILVSVIKENRERIRLSSKTWLLLFFASYLMMYVILIRAGKSFVREVHSPLCFLSAFAMFGAVANTRTGYRRAVNWLAGYTFGAYLLQTHKLFHPYLWEGLFRFTSVSEKSPLYFMEGIAAVIVIFVFAASLEEIRKRVMTLKPVRNVMQTLSSYGDGMYGKMLLSGTDKGEK